MTTMVLTMLLAMSTTPAAHPPPLPPAVAAALDAALAVPGGRIVAREYRASGPARCEPRQASVPNPIAGSGRYAVKVTGAGCTGWAFVHLDVFAPTAVTTRKLAAGDSLDGNTSVTEVALPPGRAAFFPTPGATASRALPAGRLVAAADVRSVTPAFAAGVPIRVVVRSGLVQLEQNGRFLPCGSSRACAVLPSGKHVEGRLEGMQLIVEAP
jgi:hypothetical protein